MSFVTNKNNSFKKIYLPNTSYPTHNIFNPEKDRFLFNQNSKYHNSIPKNESKICKNGQKYTHDSNKESFEIALWNKTNTQKILHFTIDNTKRKNVKGYFLYI